MAIVLKFGRKAKKNFIQEANRRSRLKGTMGTFGKWCRSQGLDSDGKVTKACINKGLRSGDTAIVRRANFARNIKAYAGAVHRKHTRFGSYHLLSKKVSPEFASIIYEHMSKTKSSSSFGKRKRRSQGPRKKYTPAGGRKSPGVSATKFPIGTVRQGLDGGNWVIKKASNGTKRWVKLKSAFGKRKRLPAGQRRKYTPAGGRKSPGVSANNFPVGTVRKGLDGGNWMIKQTSNGTRRWVKVNSYSFGKRRKYRFGNERPFFFEGKNDKILTDALQEVETAEKIIEQYPEKKTSKLKRLIKKIKQKIVHLFSSENLMNVSEYVSSLTSIITSITTLFTSIIILTGRYENLLERNETVNKISSTLGRLLKRFTRQHSKTERDIERFLKLKYGHLPKQEREHEIRLWKLKNIKPELPSVPKRKKPRPPSGYYPPPSGYYPPPPPSLGGRYTPVYHRFNDYDDEED